MQNRTIRAGSDSRLTRVWARNFKSIRELDLQLGPLTVLVGPNATGKSNVLDVLQFIKEALTRNLDAAIVSRHGIAAVRRSTRQGGTRDIELGFEARRGDFEMRYGFVLGSRAGVYRVKREYGSITPSDPELYPITFEIKDGEVVKPVIMTSDQIDTSELSLPRRIWWIIRALTDTVNDNPKFAAAQEDVFGVLNLTSQMRIYRLFPDPMRRPHPPMDDRVLAEDGSNLASVLRAMSKRKSPYFDEIISGMGRVVPGLSDLDVRQFGGYLVVRLRHSVGDNGGPSSLFDLPRESDGTVRLLGMLTAFYQDLPNSLVGVEEPELAIHPGAIAVLADVMIEASNRFQVVATTHSPDLIDRLPIESIRAVEMRDGCTEVGHVSETQSKAVMNGLFTSGELHSMEGLVPRS